MASVRQMYCCGVREIDGISGMPPREAVLTVARSILVDFKYDHITHNRVISPRERPACGALIFTGVVPERDGGRSYSYRFAAFLRKNNLGVVTEAGPTFKNPNTAHNVKVWMWVPDMAKLKEFYDKEAEEVLMGSNTNG